MRGIILMGFLCAVGAGIAGCADPNTKATHIHFGHTTDAVTMGPPLRMVTERERELDDGRVLPTICSEPSPDVAIAFGRTIAAQGNIQEPGGPSGGGNVNIQTTETATQLAGRTAGVLALRDGLYAACQSYVNGVLGHDGYALILSQYGNLLVAVAGQQTSGAPAVYSAQESMVVGMLVTCLSEYDPTRSRPHWPNGKPMLNPLISISGCKYLLNQIAQGKPFSKIKVASATSSEKPKPGGATQKVTKTTITKTVTQSSGPAAAESGTGGTGAGGAAGGHQ